MCSGSSSSRTGDKEERREKKKKEKRHIVSLQGNEEGWTLEPPQPRF